MFKSKKPKSPRHVRYTRKFCLGTDTSYDTWCSRALDTQVSRVIAERAIYLLASNGWAEFWPEPNFLSTY